MSNTLETKTFEQLLIAIINIYDDLLMNPQAIGLAVRDNKSGELKVKTSQHISCIKKMFYAIGLASEISQNIPKYTNCENGFVFRYLWNILFKLLNFPK